MSHKTEHIIGAIFFGIAILAMFRAIYVDWRNRG